MCICLISGCNVLGNIFVNWVIFSIWKGFRSISGSKGECLQAVFDQGRENIRSKAVTNQLLKEISGFNYENLEFIQFPLPGLNEFDFTSRTRRK